MNKYNPAISRPSFAPARVQVRCSNLQRTNDFFTPPLNVCVGIQWAAARLVRLIQSISIRWLGSVLAQRNLCPGPFLRLAQTAAPTSNNFARILFQSVHLARSGLSFRA